MSEPLLVRILKRLSPTERRAVTDFSRLPIINRRPEVTRLADYLAEKLGKPSAQALSAERLFAAACPGEPFDAARLRHIQSYLLDVLRRYLAFTEWQSEPGAEQSALVRALRRRELDGQFEKEWENRGEALEKSPLRNARYHLQRYEWLYEQLEQTTKRQRAAGIELRPLPDELTAFYLAEMLRHACLALTHQAVAGATYRFEALEAVLAALSDPELTGKPAVSVYLHAYRALLPGSTAEDFEKLKARLDEHTGRFADAEMRGLYLLAINACIRRMNAGQREYVREAFGLYRAALENGFLLENGVLSGFTYKNILRLAAALGEHAWAETFLETYHSALHARERDNLYRYNRAFLYFQQHDYARAMPLLRQVDFDDPLNSLDARRLLLRSYFELGEWDALDALLHSFATYLRRQKNLGYHRATNEKLLFFVRKLLEISQADRPGRQRLRAELESLSDVAERAWLLSII